VRRLRAAFPRRRRGLAPGRLRFIDETGLNLALTRRYGRAAPGVRVVDSVPQNRGQHISLRAALGTTGLSAPMTVEGAVDTEVFRVYVGQVLGPTLRSGDSVRWDNLAVHQAAGIAEAIAARGAHLEPLPPYSPELNPSEQCWAQLKTALRQARARTREALDAALKRALRTITPADAQAWFAHCGYRVHSQVIRYNAWVNCIAGRTLVASTGGGSLRWVARAG
jgi:transposase